MVLFLHNTSHCDDEPYPDLLFEKGGNGFPTVSFLGADGRLLVQVGHVVTMDQLEQAYVKLHDYQRRKAAIDDPAGAAARELFALELREGYITFAEAQAALQRFSLDDEELRPLQPMLVNLEFRDILRSTKRTEMAAGGAKFLAMLDAGRVPTSSQVTSFWQYLFAHAVAESDVALYERLMRELKERMAGDRRLDRYLSRLEQGLEQLKESLRDH